MLYSIAMMATVGAQFMGQPNMHQMQAEIHNFKMRLNQMEQNIGNVWQHVKQGKMVASNGSANGGKDGEDDEPPVLNKDLIMIENVDVKWDDVVGNEEGKNALKGFAVFPLQLPHLFEGKHALEPWSGVLLYGPPGTGKTYLAKALASTSDDLTFIAVSSADLMNKYVGEAPKAVRELFILAREHRPAVVFVDEVDMLASKRTSGDNGGSMVRREVLTEFLIQMDGVGSENHGIVVVGATNRPWDIDAAVLGRFQKKIHVKLPEEDQRLHILRGLLKDVQKVDGLDDDLVEIAKDTNLFSARDLKALVQEARHETLLDLRGAKKFLKVSPHPDNGDHAFGLVPVAADYKPKEGEDIKNVSFTKMLEHDGLRAKVVLPAMSMRHLRKAVTKQRKSVYVPESLLQQLEEFETGCGESR